MRRTRALTLLAAGGLALNGCTDRDLTGADPQEVAAPSTPTTAVADWVPGRVIVRFAPSAGARDERVVARTAREIVGSDGLRSLRPMRLERTWILQVAPGTEREAAARLAEVPGVEFAEVDHLIELVPCETGTCDAPAEFFFGRKWDLHNTGTIFNNDVQNVAVSATGAVDADIDWLEAYEALGRDQFEGSAVIAIIDSGILETHGDLAGKVIGAQNFAVGYPSTFTADRDGHGTHVAGIAAASGVQAIPGVAWGRNIKLLNAKACDLYRFPDGSVRSSCPTSSSAEAIVWATDNGADVINLSLGGSPNAVSGSAAQQAALAYARSQGVLPFCSSGNDAASSITFPGRFEDCVAVGATSWSDTRAGYSNYAAELDLSAPGGQGGAGFPFGLIFSLSNNASNISYTYKSGTSMATPQVAGLAALLIAAGVGDGEAVLQRMRETADDLGAPGRDPEFGHGRINACRALDPAQVRIQTPGAFNRRGTGEGVVPVVVFGSERFDPALLDEAALSLGDGSGAGAGVALKGGEYRAALTDVDGDGFVDLDLRFPREAVAAAVSPGAGRLVLSGNVGCRRVQGSQAVNVTG